MTTKFRVTPLRPLEYSSLFTTGTLYQSKGKKSRLFFRHFHNQLQRFTDISIIFPTVRPQAPGAVLDAAFGIGKATPAALPQRIQRTVAEQTAEFLRISPWVAGKILAVLILNKITSHCTHLYFIILLISPHCKKKDGAVRRPRQRDKPLGRLYIKTSKKSVEYSTFPNPRFRVIIGSTETPPGAWP